MTSWIRFKVPDEDFLFISFAFLNHEYIELCPLYFYRNYLLLSGSMSKCSNDVNVALGMLRGIVSSCSGIKSVSGLRPPDHVPG